MTEAEAVARLVAVLRRSGMSRPGEVWAALAALHRALETR